jgi:hypothetical protein
MRSHSALLADIREVRQGISHRHPDRDTTAQAPVRLHAQRRPLDFTGRRSTSAWKRLRCDCSPVTYSTNCTRALRARTDARGGDSDQTRRPAREGARIPDASLPAGSSGRAGVLPPLWQSRWSPADFTIGSYLGSTSGPCRTSAPDGSALSPHTVTRCRFPYPDPAELDRGTKRGGDRIHLHVSGTASDCPYDRACRTRVECHPPPTIFPLRRSSRPALPAPTPSATRGLLPALRCPPQEDLQQLALAGCMRKQT